MVESFHTLGFEEASAVDLLGITNCWLSNSRKQFWASSFNYNTAQHGGKILHPKVDGAIVRPDLQLPIVEMISHLMYLMSLLDIQVTRPFSFATLFMLYD